MWGEITNFPFKVQDRSGIREQIGDKNKMIQTTLTLHGGYLIEK